MPDRFPIGSVVRVTDGALVLPSGVEARVLGRYATDPPRFVVHTNTGVFEIDADNLELVRSPSTRPSPFRSRSEA